MLPVYFGHDERAEAGTTVFVRSVIANARKPLTLTPLTRMAVMDVKEGTNAFTFRRFLVPWVQGFTGTALFVDGNDMLCRADLNDVLEHADPAMAVQVVKHDYLTKHPRKYVGTAMESDNRDYERKQWAAMMLLQCGHPAWRQVTPEFVASSTPMDLLQLRFIPDECIGTLPVEWNWLADEHGENASAKLLHFTAGIPAFAAHAHAPMADEWHASLHAATKATG